MTGIAGRWGGPDGLSWTERLVAPGLATVTAEAARGFWGLLLAGVYGLALGTRHGGADLWQHALGVPAGLASVALVGVPSLFVFLALVDVPISPVAAFSVAMRALGVSGLVLAGLAPAAALFVVTTDSGVGAMFAGLLGLLLGGGVGLVHLLQGLSRPLREAGSLAHMGGSVALAAFSVLSIALCLRVWWGLLPLLGGGA